jgi:RNA polymerase sigma-70 factor (ECF subfamily)
LAQVYTFTYSEEELIVHLKRQDSTAITQLYVMYSASLYGVILRIVKHEMMAEEIMQDCFIKIWRSFPLYDSTKGRLFTWLITIARHLAIDKIRSQAYRQHLITQNLDSVSAYAQNAYYFKPECIGVKELTCILPIEQKQVIDLFYFEGYSQSQVAKALAIPLGTVKTRLRRALQLLRKLTGNLSEGAAA